MVQTIVTGTGIQSVRHVKLVRKEAYIQGEHTNSDRIRVEQKTKIVIDSFDFTIVRLEEPTNDDWDQWLAGVEDACGTLISYKEGQASKGAIV